MLSSLHPTLIIRATLVTVSFVLLISLFVFQPYLIKNNHSVHQIDYGTVSEKDITPIDPKYHKALTTNHKLLIILISSNSTIWRVPQLMEAWGNAFIQTRFSAGLFFEFLENRNKTYISYKSIPYIQKYQNMMKSIKNQSNIKDIDLAIKEINAIDYYLSNTKAEWLFRGVDDTFVNMNEFPRFFTSLPDPTGKPFLYGDCIDSDTPFLHGGSGILMSREMAKILLNHSIKWLRNIEHPEETYFSKLIESAGFNITDFGSPYFMGIFNKNNRELDEIPNCTNSINQKHKCPNYVSSIRKTVFFHDKYHKMTMENWTKLVEEEPYHNLNWYHGKTQELFCF